MATEVTKQIILDELKKIQYPGYSRNIVSFGLVKNVTVCNGDVKVEIQLASSSPEIPQQIKQTVQDALKKMDGVKQANVVVEAKPAQGHAHAGGVKEKISLPGIKQIIAIASGKGGVGKSTVAVNLALALKAQGKSVGLMDADIYGPSIPMMMGTHQNPDLKDGKIAPIVSYGIKLISIGFLIAKNAPAIWRGPIVSSVITQFLQDVNWGDLDYLLIDLPPGTGDIQLTLVQSVQLSGAVIVTTPQDVALLDVAKANEMFKAVNTKIIGIIENMSSYICPKCSHEEALFRKGGGDKEAQRIQVPLLGQIPLEPDVCIGGDIGKPVFIQPQQSKAKAAFEALAQNLIGDRSSIISFSGQP